MDPVIYQIRNKVNGKVYVGSAVNVKHRWSSHRSLLRKGIHHSIHLQRAFDLDGEVNFAFEILEIVQCKEDLLTREKYWIDSLNCYNDKFGYNIALQAGAPMAGRTQTEEANRKTGTASRDWHKKNKGTPKYEAYLNNLSNSLIGHPVSDKTKAKIGEKAKLRTGENNPFYGKTHSKETRNRLSKQRKGVIRSKEANKKTSETLKSKKANQGSSNGSAKLTEADVIQIKRRLSYGDKTVSIANDYGVSKSTVGFIKQGVTWKHILVR